MIDYYSKIFNKPHILWSATEEVAVVLLVIAVILIITIVAITITAIIYSVRKHKYFNCVNTECNDIKSPQHCASCKRYIKCKKEKKHDK